METPNTIPNANAKPPRPFRKAVLRGMAVLFPPLFTIIIFAWVISTTDEYVLEPVKGMVCWTLVKAIDETKLPEDLPKEDRSKENPVIDGVKYQRLEHLTYVTYIPKEEIYDKVLANPGDEALVPRGEAFYRRFVERYWLTPWRVTLMFLAVFIIVLWVLGKFMAAGIGRFFVRSFEQFIERLPLIRNVYSSVKQVSDFLFTEREIKVEYTRVVAVEYPRKGIFSLGLVTGESMLDIRAAANEPVVSVLMATSPMPVTGFTVTVRKSQTIELNITIEQAFQFIISCGVVIPPQQLQQMRKTPDDELEGIVDGG